MSPPSIQLFVSDVDGTLVRPDKSLAQATIDAFARLRAAGVLATLISARPPSGMLRLAKALDLQGPLGAFNGGTLIDANGVVLNAQHLAPDVVAAALVRLDAAGVDVWLFAHGLWYSRNADGVHTDHERLATDIEPTLIADFSGLDHVDKIVGVSDDHAALERLEAEVITAVAPGATVARSQPYYLDITAPAANKGDGIVAIARAAKAPLSRVAAIGDMPNDLPMFARAGLSIAMGQAPAAVQAAARFVTASNQHDGVALAIDRYILGPEGVA